MKPITICCTYYKSLGLANLAAALFSLRQQDLSSVERLVIFDNDTEDLTVDILRTAHALEFPVPLKIVSEKHRDSFRTHSWSTNQASLYAETPWILFTRADYILDFDLMRRFSEIVAAKGEQWSGFITANVHHLNADVNACEQTSWRVDGPGVLRALGGVENDYTEIDAGVCMLRRDVFQAVGGLDEGLTAWGHAQTHFQWKLHIAGFEFARIPEPLFFHPKHAAPRDLALAHAQLAAKGVDLRGMWSRYAGANPYENGNV